MQLAIRRKAVAAETSEAQKREQEEQKEDEGCRGRRRIAARRSGEAELTASGARVGMAGPFLVACRTPPGLNLAAAGSLSPP